MTFEDQESEGLWILNWFMRNGWYKECGAAITVRGWKSRVGGMGRATNIGISWVVWIVCFKLRFSVVRGSHIVLVLHI
jgi:hypothetical protein